MPVLLSKKELIIAELLVLHGELCGLELVKHSRGQLVRGTVYVTLGRMADKGHIASRLDGRQPMIGGPRRRLYKLTLQGQRTVEAVEAARLVLARA